MRLSIIVPVYNSPGEIRECLAALLAAPGAGEIIVVDDASTDETAAVAAAMGVRVLRMATNAGPAAARNHGARHAGGDVLFFVDADVVVAPDAVERVLRAFEDDVELAAVFGSYDAQPRAPGLVSQYRNLLHHYVHQHGSVDAFTFWSGCGAIRRRVFEAVGGFDERAFPRAIEDIELGYRVRGAGHCIRLDKALQCTHLKRWTLRSMVRTDMALRAVPWTRLILASGTAPRDLNLHAEQRASVALVGVAALALPLALVHPAWLALAAAALAGVTVLNRDLYGFFHRRGGAAFALGAFMLHLLYFLGSGLSFLYVWLDFRLRGHRGAPLDGTTDRRTQRRD
jgi:hypothetical protein